MSDSIPTSSLFTRYRRYLPGLVGAGAAALTSAYFGGQRASKLIDRDSSRFPTWSERPAPSFKPRRPMYSARRSYVRRKTRRSYRRRRVPRFSGNFAGLTVLKGTSLGPIIVGAAGAPADVLQLITFSLGAVPNYATYSALYSKYKILKCTLQFVPRWDSGNPNTSGVVAVNGGTTQLISSIDDSNTTTPASRDAILGLSNARIQNIAAGRSVWVSLRPKPITNIQGVNVGTSMSEWILTSNATVPHYGLSVCLRNLSNAQTVDVYVTYTVAFAGRA